MSFRHTLLFGCVFLSVGAGAAISSSSQLSFVPRAYAADEQATSLSQEQLKQARKFVSGVADDGIGFLSDQSITDVQRAERFRQLLIDSFDMKTIARFALGRYWRTASPEEKREYFKLFQERTVDVYSKRFSEYQGQKLEVRDARLEGGSDAIVTSYVISPDSPDVQVDWRVRHKDGSFKVVDIIVEGVSMVLTQRSDYSSVIQRGGGKIEVLLAHLR